MSTPKNTFFAVLMSPEAGFWNARAYVVLVSISYCSSPVNVKVIKAAVVVRSETSNPSLVPKGSPVGVPPDSSYSTACDSPDGDEADRHR